MTQPPAGDPRALSGMQALLRVFEQMRERPRRRKDERLRPLLLITGPADATRLVTQVLARRCGARDADRGGPARGHVDPYARLDADVPDVKEPGALLRRISQELSEHHPRWEPGLRFPRLSMALWLQELRDDPEHADLRRQLNAPGVDRRKVMRRMIRQRGPVVVPGDRPSDRAARRKDKVATLFTYLEQIAPIGVVVIALLSATAASTLDLAAALTAAGFGLAFLAGQAIARTRDWAGRRRYEWFTGQPYLEGRKSDDFLGFAIKAVTQQHGQEEVEGLLVAALLADLRQSYTRLWWRRATWARVRYPVLLLDGVTEGTEGYEIIRHIEAIRLDTTAMDPLVVVAALEPAALTEDFARLVRVPATAVEAVDPHGVAAAWEQHQAGQVRFAALGPRRAIRVEIDADDAEMSGSADRFVDPPRARPKLTHPALPWLAMGAALAGSLTVIGAEVVRYCDPYTVWRASNGECVGITDGSYVFDPRLAAVEHRIRDLNEAVIDSGQPYVNIVYLGGMTVDPATRNSQPDLLAGFHGELAGLAIAAQELNSSKLLPRVRILLANAGSKNRYAGEVAEKIKQRADGDRRLVATVGFGISKRQTQEAIEKLGESALPMIGTTNTFDGTARRRDGSFSPYYFRLAPSNRKEAEHAAYWARHGQLSGLRARTVAVFYSAGPDELYSPNLAQDFASAFLRDGQNDQNGQNGQNDQNGSAPATRAPGAGARGGNAAEARMYPYSDSSGIPQQVLAACQNPPDLFYFAGRSDDFQPFVQQLSTTACGRRRTVLGGDDVTIYVTDNARQIGRTDTLRLYYTPLAAREAWEQAGQALPPFYPDYDAVAPRLEGKGEHPSRTHAAMSYDAVLAVATVAHQLYGAQRQSLPTAGAVLAALTEPDAAAPPPQGASGLLRFGPRTQGHAVLDKPMLLTAVGPDGRLRVVAVCGKLTQNAPARRGACPPQ
ncbi:MAG TPA: ABC transporter substrate-binding protein [Streptosporangiaceae bacterium]|nr:ABC transporter substrate-binding protein [Streptosporangiaceae bacterium]